jgi:hypothetical protein
MQNFHTDFEQKIATAASTFDSVHTSQGKWFSDIQSLDK